MIKLRMIAAAVLGVTMTIAPAGGFAKENQGKGHGKGHAAQRVQVQRVEVPRHRQVIVPVNRLVAVNCPPGLAKKDPACVPPGQARKHSHNGVVVGDILDLGAIHLINQPGLYGLGEPPLGNRYAVVDGRLVRIDPESGRLLSIIRLVDAILD